MICDTDKLIGSTSRLRQQHLGPSSHLFLQITVTCVLPPHTTGHSSPPTPRLPGNCPSTPCDIRDYLHNQGSQIGQFFRLQLSYHIPFTLSHARTAFQTSELVYARQDLDTVFTYTSKGHLFKSYPIRELQIDGKLICRTNEFYGLRYRQPFNTIVDYQDCSNLSLKRHQRTTPDNKVSNTHTAIKSQQTSVTLACFGITGVLPTYLAEPVLVASLAERTHLLS